MLIGGQVGVWLKDFFQKHQMDVDFVEFNGGHTVPLQVVSKLTHLLGSLLASPQL